MKKVSEQLIDWGVRPKGPYFGEAKDVAIKLFNEGYHESAVKAPVLPHPPQMLYYSTPSKYEDFLPVENELEEKNKLGVTKAMDEIMKVPTVTAGAIMPDACPAGTIPVGAVVETKDALHPGYHSADVCCSMALSVLSEDIDQKAVLDMLQGVTPFGYPIISCRDRVIRLEESFVNHFELNPFLHDLGKTAIQSFGTQGDGNHFYYVGRRSSDGRVCIVSHHGSRNFGARVFKVGLRRAKKKLNLLTDEINLEHAWLNINDDEGRAYWQALDVVREWTKRNHFDLHQYVINQMGLTTYDRYWNPHNFVFRKGDSFFHAKGATPSYTGHSGDDSGRTLIPLNMDEPILITKHSNNDKALGFAPHGAGRNLSRTQFLRDIYSGEKPKSDMRTWCGREDPSEFPQAYKNADKMIGYIEQFDLAEIDDFIDPYGSIMAGDVDYYAPWRVKKREKDAERLKTESNN